MQGLADQVRWVLDVPWMFGPVMTVIPLQILAYHIAALHVLDMHQPANLEMSVAVG